MKVAKEYRKLVSEMTRAGFTFEEGANGAYYVPVHEGHGRMSQPIYRIPKRRGGGDSAMPYEVTKMRNALVRAALLPREEELAADRQARLARAVAEPGISQVAPICWDEGEPYQPSPRRARDVGILRVQAKHKRRQYLPLPRETQGAPLTVKQIQPDGTEVVVEIIDQVNERALSLLSEVEDLAAAGYTQRQIVEAANTAGETRRNATMISDLKRRLGALANTKTTRATLDWLEAGVKALSAEQEETMEIVEEPVAETEAAAEPVAEPVAGNTQERLVEILLTKLEAATNLDEVARLVELVRENM